MAEEKLPHPANPVKAQQRDFREAFRLAKKAKGLAHAEKHALLAICDTTAMSEVVCRKSISTITNEYGCPNRTFRYGVRGRKRKDGTDYFPGLLHRGLIDIVQGGVKNFGRPTVYRVNLPNLRDFVLGTSAESKAQSKAQGTDEVRHNESESKAQAPQKYGTVADEVNPKFKREVKPPPLPPGVSMDLWNDFLASRRRQPVKPEMQTALAKQLQKLYDDGEDILERLLFATGNGTALQPDPTRKHRNKPPGSDTTQDHIDRINRNAAILGVVPKAKVQ